MLPPVLLAFSILVLTATTLPLLPLAASPRPPQACVKKDERALRTLVQRYIQLPLPDYGGRLALLGAFAQVGRCRVAPAFLC